MSGPIRTCVGCGERAPQADLRRFVLAGDALRPDADSRQPGRGAYLHVAAACFDRFVRRRGPVRSLRAAPSRVTREALVAGLSAMATCEAR